MTKYYLKYDSLRDKFFVDVYESIKRSDKDLQEYAKAVEHLAKEGSELVFDTKDFDLLGTYEFLGDIFDLRDILGMYNAAKVVNEIAFKNNNSFRIITEKVLVTIEGEFVTLKLKDKEEKKVNVNVSVLEDVLKHFHPNIDGNETKQEEILEKIRTILK